MKITVIIPTFNSEETILRALKSVFAQTYPAHEVIVIDDGSSDRTIEVIRSQYNDVIIHRFEQNRGPSAARNAGIELAAGDWIAFLDSDDEWLPDKLRRQCDIVKQNPGLKWCCCNYYIHKQGRRQLAKNPQRCRKFLQGKSAFQDYFTARRCEYCDIHTSSLIIYKDILNEIGVFRTDMLWNEDWDLWWRIAHRWPKIGFDVQPQSIHYLHYENPVLNQRRLESKKGIWLTELLTRQLEISEREGSLRQFRPFARMYLRNCLLSMLFIGLTAEAKMMLRKFSGLLTYGQFFFFKAMLLTAPVSLSLFRASVWACEKLGIITMSHRNWDYYKAYKQMKL